ncbi:MAG: hypothetical protein K6E40_11450 [Desulfovibrio sp.]|nr:hypothetical protein [Desulfovibrio sp.]
MAPSFVYVAVFSFLMASGQTMEADDGSYPTEDACLLQAEADAKLMSLEWEWAERTGHIQPFKGVEVRCEKRTAPKAQKRGARHGR